MQSASRRAPLLAVWLGLAWLGLLGLAWHGMAFTAHYRRSTHEERDCQLQHVKKEETMSECLTTMPHGPGTPPLNRACCQKHSSCSCNCHELLQFTVVLRPISAAHPRGTSSVAADWMLLYYTAALLYTTTNTAGENRVADTKLNVAF